LFSADRAYHFGHSLASGFSAIGRNEGGKEMAEGSVEQEILGTTETVGEVRLWQAVVVRVIEDWMSGPLRQKRQAECYLFDRNTDFARVCESAGLNADDLRARLTRIRGRLGPEAAVAA
jgi:hypothetical protein